VLGGKRVVRGGSWGGVYVGMLLVARLSYREWRIESVLEGWRGLCGLCAGGRLGEQADVRLRILTRLLLVHEMRGL
jgi:hypothetical protein